MAVACEEFDIHATIYMEQKNYDLKTEKVATMKKYYVNLLPQILFTGSPLFKLAIAHRGDDV